MLGDDCLALWKREPFTECIVENALMWHNMILKLHQSDKVDEFLKLLVTLDEGKPHICPNFVWLWYKLELPSGDGIVSPETRINWS